MPCLTALCLSAFLVVDGDTIKLPAPGKDLYFRVWGIDAPEMDTPQGPPAARVMDRLTADRTLSCDLRDVDRYGRPVVRCDLPDGSDLACELVRAGAARDWPKYSGGYYRRCAR